MNKPFILYTDASAYAIGALLTQERTESDIPIIPGLPSEQPIHFMSRKLNDKQQKWSVTQREAFAIISSIRKLRFYLHNAEFTIRTDHRPLVGFLTNSKEGTNRKIQSWMLELQQHSAKIEYIEGPNNTFADMLSRIPNPGSITQPNTTSLPEI